MVIDVFISSSGMPSRSACMSPLCAIETPTLPTSPRARGWSGSYPVCVGRSKATDSPVCPLARFDRYNSLEARADEWPEYVRMSQGRSATVTFSPNPRVAENRAPPAVSVGRRRSAAVVVEPGAGLAAQALRCDHPPQQRGGREVRVVELGVERVEDGQAGVEPDQVEQLERPHRE